MARKTPRTQSRKTRPASKPPKPKAKPKAKKRKRRPARETTRRGIAAPVRVANLYDRELWRLLKPTWVEAAVGLNRFGADYDRIRRVWRAHRDSMRIAILSDVTAAARTNWGRVNAYHRREFTKTVLKYWGIDTAGWLSDPQVNVQMREFITRNVGLVSRLTQDTQALLDSNVTKALLEQPGDQRALAQAVKRSMKAERSRVSLIARDQVSKATGQMNQIRQQGVGIKKFMWSSSEDEKVRPQHRDYNGRIYRWDAPPPEGIPGTPIRCRCVARPVLPPRPERG